MRVNKKEEKILNQIKQLVAVERKTLAQIIELLQVVHDTRLYAKLGHSSLVKFLVKEYGYSESAAYRRFCALKLTREIPETKKMISSGSLGLSNITQLQTILKEKSTSVKRQAIARVQNKTSLETRKTLFAFAPEKEGEAKDSIRQTSRDCVELRVTLRSTTAEKIDKLKARTKCYETSSLIDRALDLLLERTDPALVKARQSKKSSNPRTISMQTKREVYKRAQGACEFKGCTERHFLEYDHVKPVGLGGTNERDNIRLVCKAHNQLFAIESFGLKKMNRHLGP